MVAGNHRREGNVRPSLARSFSGIITDVLYAHSKEEAIAKAAAFAKESDEGHDSKRARVET